ncbi:MAG: UDP-N-acetylglucosamine pyrophosphorylase [Lachnospiraceae bacterium]|nr:UDP-N-acetylglucosamine pyrophosphorylase [Lachnospiraceae bacterium]
MKQLMIPQLYNISETIASDYMKIFEYPWQLLPHIGEYTRKIGKALDPAIFDEVDECVWIAKSAEVAKTAMIEGPCIIDESAEIRHCVYIRGNAIVGKFAVVGNSTEIKNSLLFNWVQVPHYNYIGDSILGWKAHFGAGAITSNVKADGTLVNIKAGKIIESGLKKVGAMIGDNVEVGCNTVLNPGTVIGRNSVIYPMSMVRGYVPADSIYKKQGEIADRIMAH